MNAENGDVVTRHVVDDESLAVSSVIDPDPEEKPSFGFLGKMGAGKDF